MPSPARSTGTSSGGSAIATPVVEAIGVTTGRSLRARCRVASYTNRVASSRSAARNSELVLRSSRITVSRACTIGCSTTVVCTISNPRLSQVTVLSSPGLVDVARDNATLRRFLHGLPGVDQVGAEARAAALATRSIKTTAKAWAIDTAISMIDLTTLEGADTYGKVRSMCAKAV